MPEPQYNAATDEYELQDAAGCWYFGMTPDICRNAYLEALRVRSAHDRKQLDNIQQHSAGFAAHCNGAEFVNDQPAAWQQGWLDANDLGAFAPIEFFRLNAEV